MMPHQGNETLQQLGVHRIYRNPDNTKRDILQTIHHYKGLTPKLDSLVFNNGEKKELVCLDGTIPVPYKGNTYNIPVCIWLLESHPYNAPVCYVKPTNDMQIKASAHVDPTGKIYLPYLQDWKYNSSDLVGLVQVMIIVFGEHPPVYAKPRSHTGDYGHSQTPYPLQSSGVSYMPMPNASTQPPQYAYTPYSSHATSSTPYPPTTSSYKYTAAGVSPASSNPAVPNSIPPQGSYTPQSMPFYPQYPPSSGVFYPTTSPMFPSPHSYPVTQVPVSAPNSSNTISEEHIKASLLTAVEDKMKRRLREVFSQAQAEMDVLKRTQDDLTQGKAKLEDIINKLETEQLELDKNITMLRDKNEAMTEIISKLENQETVNVDEAVVTTTPLYKQLLNAFAEENATEDAIYYLGEALRRGIIDLDVFLKHVRELSRKQFMLRALMQKCREKANLPC